MEVKEEKIITWAEARKILEKKSKEKELGYEQNNALEFLKKFSKISEKSAVDMKEELSQLSKLKDRQIVMIVNMLPQDNEDLRVLFSQEVANLTEDDKKNILKIVKKFT